MIGFNVYRNDERLCIAGVGAFGVLTACVTCVGHRPEMLARRAAEGISGPEPAELTLEVGGLKGDDDAPAMHMRWIDATLRVGDEIKIQVVEASTVDAATTEDRDDPSKLLEGKKTYVRRVAEELGWEIRESP